MDRSVFFRKIPANRKSVTFVVFLAALSGFIFFFNSNLSAQGNLLITPRRVVFEGTTRSLDLNLANTGKDTATYAISVIQIRMTDEGGFETITTPDPGQLFADKYIRFFPRSVTLGPNEAQVVKVQLIRANELAPGEYRSHFYFRAIPKVKPLGESDKLKDTTAFTVKLTPVFGITIPVIIRAGESTAKVTITDLGFSVVNDTVPQLKMVLRRTGNMSVYGDLTIDHISTQGKVTRVGLAKGVAVYTPNNSRSFQMELYKTAGVDYKTGTLRVIYSASSDIKPVRFAEAELPLR
jgi:P pilus assembly chaperone PapD